ncbi:MAG: hypothetical protein JWP31_1864, partial [Aeromicrobium sp.]|nr:hypothetical protein [Aeromicrobium sp.]
MVGVADALAVVPGQVLRGLFGLVGAVRPAPKPLHPAGTLRPVTIRRHGLPDGRRTGVPWIDEPGVTSAMARFSRATGLPPSLPDVYGLAVRVPTDGGHGDILLATTGLGAVTRFVLAPAGGPSSRAYTTLLPYRTASGPALLAAVPRSGDPQRYDLAYARPSGPWCTFALMEVDA